MDKLPDCNASIFHLSHENQKNDWDQTPKHNCHTIRRPAQLTTIGYVQANSRSWWSLKRLVHQWTNILDMLTQHDLKCVYNCHNVNLKQRLVFFPNPSACHTMDKVKIFCTSKSATWVSRRYGDQRYTRNSPTVDQSEPSSNVASKMLWSYSSEVIPIYNHGFS